MRRQMFLVFAFICATSVALAAGTGEKPAKPAKTKPVKAKPKLKAKAKPAKAKSGEKKVEKQPGGAKTWAAVDKLVEEDKYQEALDAAKMLLATAEKNDATDDWTRALVRVTQLRMALGGYETAVADLLRAKKPGDLKSKVVLGLFEAQAYATYLDGYGYEIGTREHVDGAKSLKTMTRDEIVAAMQKHHAELWKEREALGKIAVSSWKEFLEPNDYPAKVRSTMRDALAYFTADLLVNTGNWRPEEENELHRLSRKELLASPSTALTAPKIDDAKVHPLRRMVSVLADLESWHHDANELEGALEARLARLRLLGNALTETADRKLIIASLAEHLPAYKDVPWWAEGMATLAGFVRGHGDLPKARVLAKEAELKYPSTHGGQRARSMRLEIEAPDYRLEAMTVDGSAKRSLLLRHKNLKKVWFRAWYLDLEAHVEARDWQQLVGDAEGRNLLLKPADVRFAEELPATPDYQLHKTFVTPPLAMAKPGLWFVAASAREDFKDAENRRLGVALTVSDLVVVTRAERDGALNVTVLNGKHGAPVLGATVDVYRVDWNKPLSRAGSGKTDKAGGTTIMPSKAEYGGYVVFAKHGKDATFDANNQYLYKEQEENEVHSSFVYTDRAIYRPLQKISWKILAYQGKRQRGEFKVAPEASVNVELFDGNHEKIATKTVTTNAFGTAAGEFEIPTGKLLGSWFIRSSYGNGVAYVRVEEYKRPTFEVSLKDPEAPLTLNKEAVLTGEARYYFGLPVSGGAVKWKVTREPVYPWWWDYYGWRHGHGKRGHGGRGTAAQTVGFGTARVDEKGNFKLKFTPEADPSKAKDPEAKELSYRYQVSVDLTDDGGETRSASRGFRVGFVAVEAQITLPGGFVVFGSSVEAQVSRTSLDGVARAGEGEWRLLKLKGPAKAVPPADLPALAGGSDGDDNEDDGDAERQDEAYAMKTPGDELRERWSHGYSAEGEMMRWADGAVVAKGALKHPEKQGAEAKLKLPKLEPGAYRLRYETEDENGKKATAFRNFVVGGKGLALPLAFFFAAETSSVEPGGKARFLACSGIAGQKLLFDRFRDGRLVERRILNDCDEPILEIPVGEKDRGGFSYVLSTVSDHQWLTAQLAVGVPWSNKELDVELTTFRDKLTPGAKEKLQITVKSPNAEKDAAELLAYMYDKSLDAFSSHAPPTPISVYPDRSASRWSRVSLGNAPIRSLGDDDFAHVPGFPSYRGDALALFDAYGIGGLGRQLGGAGGGGHGFAMMEGAPQATRARKSARREAKADAPAAPTAAAEAPGQAEMAKDEESAPQGKKKTSGELSRDKSRSGDDDDAQPDAMPLRENFAETAFFVPQLLTGGDGRATLEFTVPDSVTGWNVWVHAVTKDLRSGSTKRETRSVKDLMVRPYLPRFFREGDVSDLKVMVNNAGDEELEGEVTLEIVDAETGKSKAAAFGLKEAKAGFEVAKGGGTDVRFRLTAPKEVGTFAFKVTARAGKLGDGEMRPLPVLPSRMRLMESRFVSLKDQEARTMEFPKLAATDDATRVDEKIVVTLDAQLFYGVMKALPYLANYPYECTEQTLNRFLATGIVSSVFKEFPAVATMAKEMAAKRSSQYEAFAAKGTNDPNRIMTLEETPWLAEARGGDRAEDELIRVLDPAIAKAQRGDALGKLVKAQNGDGGFPWFPGGRSSEYMTLYLMHGFAKAVEFGIDVPKGVVQRGWSWLAAAFRRDHARKMIKEDCCWEWLTFLNYVASAYPDDSWMGNALKHEERAAILAHSFKHWKQHSPYLKAFLALTLTRAGRAADAKLVLDSVMDSAKSEKDLGTYWLAEDRSWLWYRDTIETHAFILRALTEIEPKHPKLDGLVSWLFLNKKMNHWKSTRATAEAIYALVHYLKRTGALGVKETAEVTVGAVRKDFSFAPDHYEGRAQLVVDGPQIKPKEMAKIEVKKATKGLMFASATWHYTTEKLPHEGSGDFFTVDRAFFKRDGKGSKDVKLTPITSDVTLETGDEIEVQLALTSKHEAEYVHLRDPRAAGLEPERQNSGWRWDLGIGVYEETRDSGANFFFERLPPGQYTFKYRLRANMSGRFRVGPATVQSMYAPEFAAHSAGHLLEVEAAAPDGG